MKMSKIDKECLHKIQELCDTKDALAEAILTVDKDIDKIDIFPDHIILTFNEKKIIDTDLLVRLSEVIYYSTFTVSYEVVDNSFFGGVMEYSTVRLCLTLEFDTNEDDGD